MHSCLPFPDLMGDLGQVNSPFWGSVSSSQKWSPVPTLGLYNLSHVRHWRGLRPAPSLVLESKDVRTALVSLGFPASGSPENEKDWGQPVTESSGPRSGVVPWSWGGDRDLGPNPLPHLTCDSSPLQSAPAEGQPPHVQGARRRENQHLLPHV